MARNNHDALLRLLSRLSSKPFCWLHHDGVYTNHGFTNYFIYRFYISKDCKTYYRAKQAQIGAMWRFILLAVLPRLVPFYSKAANEYAPVAYNSQRKNILDLALHQGIDWLSFPLAMLYTLCYCFSL